MRDYSIDMCDKAGDKPKTMSRVSLRGGCVCMYVCVHAHF